jgi:hypothetical protein
MPPEKMHRARGAREAGIEPRLRAPHGALAFAPSGYSGPRPPSGRFPVISGIEAVTVLGEVDDSGNDRAARACAARWMAAGRDAFVVVPHWMATWPTCGGT